jgi:hypothetical protein
MPLSDAEIRALKPSAKHGGSGGLLPIVNPIGSKLCAWSIGRVASHFKVEKFNGGGSFR